MNKQEAIERLKSLSRMFDEAPTGAIYEAISALEKQIPKKPEFYGDSEDGKLLCPSCGEDLWDIKECGYNGCPYCLQALDWSGEDE